MRTWLIATLVLAALALTSLGYSAFYSGVAVEAARVARGRVQEYIDEEAKTRLADTYLITMPYNGRIEAIDLVEGTRVKKGQTVARIVPIDVELNVAAATAAVERLKASIRENDDATVELTGLEQALNFVQSMNRTVEAAGERVRTGEAKLAYADKNLTRAEGLAKTGAGAQDALDQARVAQVSADVDYRQDKLVLRAMESMQAATALMPTGVRQYIERKSLSREVLAKQLAEAQINLRQAEKDRDRGTMTSPVDAVVLDRPVTNERQLAAGTVLLRMGREEDLEVESDVLSQDAVRIKVGNRVNILGPAIGSQPAQGTVSSIYPAGFTKVSSLGVEQQRVKVIVKFDPEGLRRLREHRDLGVEYRVRVRIYTAEKTGALVIPRSALFRGPDGRWRVFAVRDRRASLVSVELGLTNDEHAEVARGLSENDLVILAPQTNLTDGEHVKAIGQ